MKNVLTIFRRDITAYFTSPVGYIFMIVFLLISVGIYMTTFFAFPAADMRNFFSNLPLLLCVFVPAVTMRVWAEERKENTWEMLLTFPMRAVELVLGKFSATLFFVALTLAATFTVPLMLVILGNPDNGVILSGYVGTLLLAAFFLAIGLFISGFCKDQIVAFVATLLACFAVFLVGTDLIASYIDGFFPGVGSALSELVGVLGHYNSFTRGVVEIADVLYFVAWTAIFLWLNVLYIDGRGRPAAKLFFATAIVLCLAIGITFNWLVASQSFGRFDLTEDKIYTVSPATETILSQLDVPVQVNLYVTRKEKMPTALKSLERDIRDKLEEMGAASGGNIDYKTVYLEVGNVLRERSEEEGGDDAKAIEERMLDKGVQPVAVATFEEEGQSQQYVYSSIGVAYREKAEEIINGIMPQNLSELEYRLVNIAYKLTREEPPKVALVAPKEAVNIPPQLRQLYMQMGQQIPQQEDPYIYLERVLQGEKYEVQRVELTKNSPLPEDYDTLVVVNPRELDARQRWEINRALLSGKSVVLAVQQHEFEYNVTREGLEASKRDENPNVNELLERFGLGVSQDILMDVDTFPLRISAGSDPLAQMLGMGHTIRPPVQINVTNANMSADMSVTARLDNVTYLWGTALTIDSEKLKELGLESEVIMTTTKEAWTIPGDTMALKEQDFLPPVSGRDEFPLMVLVKGQFPDAFKDEARPAWAAVPPAPGMPPMPEEEEDPEVAPVTPAPGQLVLLGCSEMYRRNFIENNPMNLDLFLNSIDAVTLGDEIINVRGNKPFDRMISREDISATERGVWKFVNYGVVNLTIITAGILVAVYRRQRRNAYAASLEQAA